MIELLLVISLIGLLSAVMISLVNPSRQRAVAEEAVLISDLEKVCLGLKTYYEGENETLPAPGGTNNPLAAGAGNEDIAGVYISAWPENFVYNLAADGTTFSVHVQRVVDTTSYYKCTNFWSGVEECDFATPMGACN